MGKATPVIEPPTDLAGFFNNIFRTFQLITLQFPADLQDNIPWQLQIARLLVPVAAVIVITSLLVTHHFGQTTSSIPFVIALTFGLWGLAIKEPEADWFNIVFRTFQLITLQFPTNLQHNIPWQLQIARLMVPLTAFFWGCNLIVGAARDAARQGPIAFQHSLEESTKRPTPQPRGSKIFISYRRLDTGHVAGRVYDRLAREFPEDEIFFDVDTIPIGVNFKQHISSAVSSSAVMLVLVGGKWLGPNWKRSPWRFGSKPQEDFVQVEIESALDLGVPVIPLLVDNVAMPYLDALPNSIAEFVSLNAAAIRSGRDFHKDIEHVLEIIGPLREQGIRLKQG